MQIQIEVIGLPKGQPRGRAFIRGKHASIHPDNSADDWKALVAIEARKHLPDSPLDGPVCVDVCFRFPRIKGHFRTGRNADKLRPNAPVMHIGKPDRDNLDKAVLDVLTQLGMWRDDCQVCSGRIEKRYVRDGERPGAVISIGVIRP